MKTVIVSENPLFGEVIRESAKECLSAELVELEPNIEAGKLELLDPDVMILDESLSKDIQERMISAGCHMSRCRILMVNLYNNDFIILDSTRSTIQRIRDLKEAMTIEVEKGTPLLEKSNDFENQPDDVGGVNELIQPGNQIDKSNENLGDLVISKTERSKLDKKNN